LILWLMLDLLKWLIIIIVLLIVDELLLWLLGVVPVYFLHVKRGCLLQIIIHLIWIKTVVVN